VNAFGAECWSAAIRDRIARDVERITHWSVDCADWTQVSMLTGCVEATWFVDPPYANQGKQYKHGTKRIDYTGPLGLGAWCRSLNGQVIVTEGEDHGGWLPFAPYTAGVDTHQTGHKALDYVWTNEEVCS
jgi:hypothetical protein